MQDHKKTVKRRKNMLATLAHKSCHLSNLARLQKDMRELQLLNLMVVQFANLLTLCFEKKQCKFSDSSSRRTRFAIKAADFKQTFWTNNGAANLSYSLHPVKTAMQRPSDTQPSSLRKHNRISIAQRTTLRSLPTRTQTPTARGQITHSHLLKN